MQMEALECGAASLCMILAYYGKWLSLEQVRADCGVSRDGSNAKNVLKAARTYGLKAEGYRMETSALRNIAFPVVIHWDFNHFVVLNGFKKDKAVLNDPARGTVEVEPEQFDKSFTGIVLCFEKTEYFVPGGKPRSLREFAKKRLRGTFPAFAFVLLTGILTAGISMITLFFSRILMDNILSGKNPEWLRPFIGAMLLALFFQFVVNAIQNVYWLKIEGKLAIEAGASFMWHVLRLPVEFFTQRFAGDIASRQESNQSIASTLIGQLAPMVVNIALLVFYLAVMLNYSVVLSIVGIAAVLANMLLARMVSKKRMNMSRVMQRDAGKLSGVTMSGFEMIETIKSAGAENGFFERWAGYYAKQCNGQVAFSRANQFYKMLPALLQQLSDAAVLTIGVYLILEGEFTIGMLWGFLGFLSSFLQPVNQLVGAGQAFVEMRSGMERVEDVMNYKPDVPEEEELKANIGSMEKLTGEIDIRNISFGYNRMSKALIEGLSLRLKPGGSIALAGGSGSGKSTLVKLISGLYSPWTGEILFGGRSKSEINRGVFTGSLAVVDQDIMLFEDTILDNITMWDKSVDEAAVVAACKDAQLHDDILQREGGYSHIIKEGGKNFSGGQRQRFEIARALVQEPSILILDEATSALDAGTEQLIMEAVRARGITLVIVAHRLSTIRDCDEIIVLDKGRVAQRGSHEELMKMGGKYTALLSN